MRAIFPKAVTLALTATAPSQMIEKLKEHLSFDEKLKIIKASPNRQNLYLSVQKRLSNNHGIKSYDKILRNLAHQLNKERVSFPLTVVYLRLKYCAYAWNLFKTVVENEYVGEEASPRTRLFAEFHAESTQRMKEDILEEIKKKKSNIRILFATTALGMGVDAPNIINVIHIAPPSNMESYLQEIGRAGMSGQQSYATLYYNNFDIGAQAKVDQPMKDYCQVQDCLRKHILNYFSFSAVKQDNCCINCDGPILNDVMNDVDAETNPTQKCRSAVGVDIKLLRSELEILSKNRIQDSDNVLIPTCQLTEKTIDKLIADFENLNSEKDLLYNFDVWDEQLCSDIYNIINKFSPTVS